MRAIRPVRPPRSLRASSPRAISRSTHATDRSSLLSADEVAARLACSRRHVYALTDEGALRFVRLGADDASRQTMRWRPADVDTFIASRVTRRTQ